MTARPMPGTAEPADHLALALDVDDLDAALELLDTLGAWFSVAKVGLELFIAGGPPAVAAVRGTGVVVFADLKLHDIPTTVGRAARQVGRSGARYLTVHSAGGPAMLRAAVEGMEAGAADKGHPLPCVLGVTVLTSEPRPSPEVLAERAAMAAEVGCGGLVCAADDIPVVRAAAPGCLLVVPGIRPADAAVDDQARTATPAGAIAAGADLLVVGRAVTGAPDPAQTAAAVAEEVARALPRTRVDPALQ